MHCQKKTPSKKRVSRPSTNLNAFDYARNGLYEQLSLVAAEQQRVDEYKDTAIEKAEIAVGAFTNLAKAIIESDDDIDDKKQELLLIWRQDETERVKMMVRLTGCDCFDYIPDGVFDEMINDIFSKAESNKGLIDMVDDLYAEHMNVDINMFIGHLEEKFEHNSKTSATKVEESSVQARVLRGIGNYALDVSKVAIGTTIALWVAKKIRDN